MDARRLRGKAPGTRLGRLLRRRRPRRAAALHRLASRARSPANRRSPRSEPLDVWKDYLQFHPLESLVEPAAESLRRRAVRRSTARRCRARRRCRDRWKRGDRRRPTARWATPSASSTCERYFPPEAKAKAQAMVADLIARVRAADRRPRLDVGGDQGEGQGKARRRCSSASATPTRGATTPACEIVARRCARQRDARRGLSTTAGSSASSPRRSTAANGG